MQNRLRRVVGHDNPSFLQLFTRHHPGRAALAVLMGLVATIAMPFLTSTTGLFALPLLFTFAIATGFFKEYKRLKVKPERVTSVFHEQAINERGEEVKDNDDPTVVARIKHYDRYPVLQVLSSDPIETAQLKAMMTAPEYVCFQGRFLQFLNLSARSWPGPFLRDPVEYANDQIRERELDFSPFNPDLYYLQKESIRITHQFNESATFLLRINPLDRRTMLFYFGLCSVIKNMGGACSLLTLPNFNGHTLDWLSLGTMPEYLYAQMQLTGHTAADKPKAICSLTLVGGYALQELNPHLAVALNEAARMDGNNINPQLGCLPELLNLRYLISNVTSVAQMHEFFRRVPPDSSYIVGATDRQHYGVFELNPTGLTGDVRYRYRGYDGTDESKKVAYSAANHFHENGTQDGAMIPLSDAIGDSKQRQCAINTAIKAGKSPHAILDAADDKFTVQGTEVHMTDDRYTVSINTANTHAQVALDPKRGNTYSPSVLDLQHLFGDFLQRAERYNTARGGRVAQEDPADTRMRGFMDTVDRIKTKSLSVAAEAFFSGLMVEHARPTQKRLTSTDIEVIATGSVNTLLCIGNSDVANTNKQAQIDAYASILTTLLSKQGFTPHVLHSMFGGASLMSQAKRFIAALREAANAEATPVLRPERKVAFGR